MYTHEADNEKEALGLAAMKALMDTTYPFKKVPKLLACNKDPAVIEARRLAGQFTLRRVLVAPPPVGKMVIPHPTC